MVGSATLHEFFWSRARKSFSPLICEYLDWRRPKVPVLKREKKSHTDPSLIRRVGFWETGGDRTLVQQAISLPGGRITHKWTDCIAKKKKKKTFLPFKWSLQDSLCIVLSSSPSHFFSDLTSFLSVPPVMNCSPVSSHLSSPLFLFSTLIDRFESLLRLAVFLSLSSSPSFFFFFSFWLVPQLSWQSYGSCGSLRTTHHSLTVTTSCHGKAWPGETRWWCLHCQSSSQQGLPPL